ncbi:Uncharacterised protein [Serratia fonticola]|nr:Uncharacterised protein [Serratia fonticola]
MLPEIRQSLLPLTPTLSHRERELAGALGWSAQLRKVGSKNKKDKVLRKPKTNSIATPAKVCHHIFRPTRSVPSPYGRGLG